jgi:hypothetical protein
MRRRCAQYDRKAVWGYNLHILRRNVSSPRGSPSVKGKFSIYFILISSHFDYVLYYYIEKECLVLMCT